MPVARADRGGRAEAGAPGGEPLPARLQDLGDGLRELGVKHVGHALREHLRVHIVIFVKDIQCLQVLPTMARRLGKEK